MAGTSVSPGLAVMIEKAAAAEAFAEARDLLEVLAGVTVTGKRVERAAEAGGAALAARVRDRGAPISARKLVPLPRSPLPDMLYGVIDGTGCPMTARETAGREGKGEDGRARTREVKLAVFFNQARLNDEGYPVRDRASSSYIAGFETAGVFADLVKAEAIRRDAEQVRQLATVKAATPSSAERPVVPATSPRLPLLPAKNTRRFCPRPGNAPETPGSARIFGARPSRVKVLRSLPVPAPGTGKDGQNLADLDPGASVAPGQANHRARHRPARTGRGRSRAGCFRASRTPPEARGNRLRRQESWTR
jgi:hypothetical protein